MPYNIEITRDRTTNALKFYYASPGNAHWTNVALPSGIEIYPRRPDKIQAKRRHYIVGPPSRGLVFIEQNKTLVLIGLTAPSTAPTIADGGAGALTGAMIGYITSIHKIGATLVHESNAGPASTTLNITSKRVAWSAIPGAAIESRQTHWGLYRSVDGATPKLVTELAVGTTTFDDNVASGSLGREVPTNNGVPPYARFIELYHDRAWYAGVADPERVYYSELNSYEAVGTNSYLSTRDAEAVSSIRRRGDQLCVCPRNAFYDIQGYTATDLVMRKIDPRVGCIAHFANICINERLVFPAIDGVYTYDGAGLLYVMKDIRTFWRTEFEAAISRFNDAIAVDDPRFGVYRLLVVRATAPRSFYFVGKYRGKNLSASQLDWTFDKRNREDTAIGGLDLGDGRVEPFAGSCDGHTRRENDDTNADDDGDTFQKKMTLLGGAMPVGQRVGGNLAGSSVKSINLFLKSENQSFVITGYGGGPSAGVSMESSGLGALAGRWGPHTIASGAAANTVPKEDYFLRPTGLSGKDIAFKLEVTAPRGVAFSGFALHTEPGPNARGKTS